MKGLKQAPLSRIKTLAIRGPIPLQAPESRGQGRGGRPWRRLRKEILERDQYRCQCEDCKRLGLITLADEVDHIVPKYRGGTDDPSNLRAINHDCHQLKTQRESHGG